MSDFFPLATPASWSYAGLLNGAPATSIASLSAGPTVSGHSTTRMRMLMTPTTGDAITDTRLYAHTGAGLRLFRDITITPTLISSIFYGQGVRLFTPQVADGASIPFVQSFTGSSSNGRSWTGTLDGRAVINGIEAIDTSAGSFEALKISITGTITQAGSTGWTATGSIAETRWLVRNVGTVRIDYAMRTVASDAGPNTLLINMGLTSSTRLGPITNIRVLGMGVVIAYGDTSPGDGDGTNFAGVDVNGGVRTRIFQIQNTASSAITLDPGTNGLLTLSGRDARDFAVIRQPPSVIQPGATVRFSVRFNPSATGFRFARVAFASAADVAHPFFFDIRGAGVLIGRLNVAGGPAGLPIANGATSTSTQNGTHFGQVVEAGSVSVARTFSISNTGVGVLRLLALPRVTILGSAASDFVVISAPAARIAPGATSTFTIRFDPSLLGARSAVVSIFSNDRLHPDFRFAITGTGIG